MAVSRNSSWGELLKNALAALSGISGFTLGQRTKAQSLSVTFPSDGGGVTLGDVEIVDHSGNPLIGQKTMALSLPVVIASNQTALTITGAVTNTVLTAALNGTANALKNILVDGTGATLIGQKPMSGGIPVSIASDQSTLPIAGAVTNTVLTDIYDAINHLIRVSIQNASIAVTGTFWQATQPVSGTFWQATQPISETYTGISNGKYTILADDTVESIVAVSTPCKEVSLRAGNNAGNIFFGGASVALDGTNSDYLEPNGGIPLKISDLNLLRVRGKIGYTIAWTYVV